VLVFMESGKRVQSGLSSHARALANVMTLTGGFSQSVTHPS